MACASPLPPALVALVALTALAAGCLAPAVDLGGLGDGAAHALVPAFAQEHDHLDFALHAFGEGMEAVGYHNLVPGSDGSDGGARGPWLNSEVIVRGDHAYVGYLGAPWLFAVVNVSDAAAPVLESVFPTSNAWAMDLAVSEDGDWVFASIYNGAAVGSVFARDYVLQTGARPPDGPAAPGVAVVDVRDRASPRLTGFLPIHGLGPHTAVYHKFADGREFVFANKAEGSIPGNMVVIAEVVATPTGGRTLEPVSTFALEETGTFVFPHDGHVQEHPLTGRTLLYLAYYEPGLVIADVTDPAAPALVGVFRDYPEDEEVDIHDVHPFPSLVGGRHYTFTAPEIITDKETGRLRVYDTTDPASPVLVGSWQMPGEFIVDQDFNFSPHNFQFLPDGRVALAHGHAGVWIVDWLGPGGIASPDPAWMAEPRGVAYRVPTAAGAASAPWTPVHGAPWAWGTAIGGDGTVWVADVASGLHGLRVTA